MEVLAKKRVPVDGLCPLCKVVFNDNMPVLEFVIWCHDHVNQLQLETLCIVWWRVWFCRNRAIHSSSFFPVSEVMPWSSAYLAEYQAANLKPTLNPLGNSVAHGIAKFAISSSASGFWLGVSPPCGEEAIVADVASDL
ncbi:hypothetical protein ACOSP7_014859 [Xanthoceras sorbifolium]